jgi:hypothetical protein
LISGNCHSLSYQTNNVHRASNTCFTSTTFTSILAVPSIPPRAPHCVRGNETACLGCRPLLRSFHRRRGHSCSATCTLDAENSAPRIRRGLCAHGPLTTRLRTVTISKWEGTRWEALTISDVRNTHISHLLRMKDLEAKARLKFFDKSLSGVR